MPTRPAARIAVLAVLAAGCVACSASESREPTTSEGSRPSASLPVTVEPQVLQDVISAAFEMPGGQMRRAMRVLQFTRNLGIEECGGEPGPVDGTYNREDQSRFADLDLVREKGFFEQEAVEDEDKRLEGLDADCAGLEPDLPHYAGWRQASDSWYEVVLSAEQSAEVQDQKPALARCLSKRARSTISVADPVNDYLLLVNDENLSGATEARLADLGVFYAECAEGYFSTLRKELQKSLPQFIDRNRETLDDFAAELVAAGYVP